VLRGRNECHWPELAVVPTERGRDPTAAKANDPYTIRSAPPSRPVTVARRHDVATRPSKRYKGPLSAGENREPAAKKMSTLSREMLLKLAASAPKLPDGALRLPLLSVWLWVPVRWSACIPRIRFRRLQAHEYL